MKKKILFLSAFLSLTLSSYAVDPTDLTVENQHVSVNDYSNTTLTVKGKSEVHITSDSQSALLNSTVNLIGKDSWLFFDNMRPSDVQNNLLQYISVDGNPAQYSVKANEDAQVPASNNIRITRFGHGAVIIPHPANFQALTIYTEQEFEGDSKKIETHYRQTNLGDFDNKIRSFKLKRGYAVTLATEKDGLGYSRVFIADQEDLELAEMPNELDETVSFIRVLYWNYGTKKGWAGGGDAPGRVNATWYWNWSTGGNLTPDMEFVPNKWSASWPGWLVYDRAEITHITGYNEPDQSDQSNMKLEAVLNGWPEYLKSGLRIGSPQYANVSGSGIYAFIDSCDARGYRVDFVVLHCYWNSKSATQWYNDLKYIHERCGKRPLWITEWNNGANWTGESWPTNSKVLTRWNSSNNSWEQYTHNRPYTQDNANKQLNDITAIVNMLDTCSFVERYSFYNAVQDARAAILSSEILKDTIRTVPSYLTLTGEFYKNNDSKYFFSRKHEKIPNFKYKSPGLRLTFGTSTDVVNVVKNNSSDFDRGFIVERKVNDGGFVEVHTNTDPSVVRYTHQREMEENSTVSYRVRTILNNGELSEYSNIANYAVTNSGDIKFGNLTVNNLDYNSVFFADGYTSQPAIILGSSTRRNTYMLSPRIKQVSASSRFSVQLAPWEYQQVKSFRYDEQVPFLVLPSGRYEFGSLKAEAGRINVGGTWVQIAFEKPFDTVPVVFVTQANPLKLIATTVRVRNVTKTGFEVQLQKEAAQVTTLNSELVSYVAITEGEGVMAGKWIKVAKTEELTASVKKISYGDDIDVENPIFIAQMQTCNDGLTATAQLSVISNTFANIIKQAEKSTGNATVSAETLGWLLINPADGNVSVKNPPSAAFSIYPNPVLNTILFSGENLKGVNISIYNLSGMLVKTAKLNSNTFDVSELPKGVFFLEMDGFGTHKFIKH